MKKFTWIALVMTLILLFTAVAGAETYDHVLKRGMKDKTDTFPDGEDDIKYVQTRLAYYEYYTGNIDGNYGSGTYKAVLSFQRKNNLKADGKVGGNTWAKLAASDSVKKSDYAIYVDVKDESESVIATVGFQTLRPGDKGDSIKELQDLLKKLYFYNPNRATTSEFDTTTKDAVKGFQASVALTADGVVGEKTWNALQAAVDSPSKYYSKSKKIRRNLGQGMRGYDVYILQQMLKDDNYLPAITNAGFFDQATYNALFAFQKKNSIALTGKLDANTKACLNGESYEEAIIEADTSATSPYDRPKLKYGSHGYYVRSAQSFLIDAGYLTGSADGVFGAKTLAAVKNFQSSKGLKADGIIGADTWARLMNVEKSQGAQHSDYIDPSTGATYKTLKRGDSGYAVTHLQNLLFQLHMIDIGDIDGKYGPKTETAIKHFQKEAGLKQDGKCGYNTFAAIYHKLHLD
ncbi:MAG: peptidoglycan-binding protein [Clostridia bacterium]|nr:peptidoglycan-binding protein [Clostridia bacterium]